MTAMRLLTIPALLALALACGGVQAQVPAPAPAQPGAGTLNVPGAKGDKIARGDRKFIEEAANSGMFEVHAAQLAVAKATDPQVRSFASMLVDHHTAANNALVKIANARKVELPAAPKRSLRRDIDKLGKKKNGAEFDREFVREIGVKAHVKDIKLFERASKGVKDAELKAFVDRTLPVLRDHLAAAMKLPQSGSDAAAAGSKS